MVLIAVNPSEGGPLIYCLRDIMTGWKRSIVCLINTLIPGPAFAKLVGDLPFLNQWMFGLG